MKTIPIILISTALTFIGNTYSQSKKVCYENAYKEQLQMLIGQKPVSFKRSVFVTENAYYAGQLSYQVFCQDISNIASQLKSMI